MGTAPEDLEPSGHSGLKLKEEILDDSFFCSYGSSSPLTYHDYDIKPDLSTLPPQPPAKPAPHKKPKSSNTKTSYVPILPKSEAGSNGSESIVSNSSSEDYLYGKLDESADCIIIICNEDGDLEIGEAVTEVVTSEETVCDESLLSVPEDHRMLSPRSSVSDCGYESLESPAPMEDIDVDTWNESVSQLFPSLVL